LPATGQCIDSVAVLVAVYGEVKPVAVLVYAIIREFRDARMNIGVFIITVFSAAILAGIPVSIIIRAVDSYGLGNSHGQKSEYEQYAAH
jgi:hypothetical protein